MDRYTEVRDEQFKEIIYDIYELMNGRLALVLFKVGKDNLSVLGVAYIDEPQHLINILSDLKTFANEDSRFTRGTDFDAGDIKHLLETVSIVCDKFMRTTNWNFMNDSTKQVFILRNNQDNNH